MTHGIVTLICHSMQLCMGWGDTQLWKEHGGQVAPHLCNVEHVDVGGRHSCHGRHKAIYQLLCLGRIKWPALTLRHHQVKMRCTVMQHKRKPSLPSLLHGRCSTVHDAVRLRYSLHAA